MSQGLVELILVSGLLAIAAGLLIKKLLDWLETSSQITWWEYGFGSAIVVPVVVALVGIVGWNAAWNNVVEFNENWNGWEQKAVEVTVPCGRDGSCVYEYQCDPYWVTVEHCSGTGDDRKCSDDLEIRYHDCPYTTVEYTHLVQTTLGEYTIDSNVFSLSPVKWRQNGEEIPGDVQRGPSAFWSSARIRCESGNPGPVTARKQYKNYILASDKISLRQQSKQAETLKVAGFLPPLRSDLHDWYLAEKVSFVGFTLENAAGWQDALNRLNAAFGTERQGDLYLVVIKSSGQDLVDPDTYILAIKSYWQNPEYWDKDALSKNGVIVVVGTDGKVVKWARAETGMPIGNTGLMEGVKKYFSENQVPLTPDAVIGQVTGRITQKPDEKTGKVKTKIIGMGDQGALRRLLWGLDSPETRFVRISMSGDSPEDVGGGFKFLASQIEPTNSQKLWISVIAFLLCCGVWGIFAYIGESRSSGYPWRYR